jgi:isopentenyl-diphosphate Delta-isomerase
LENTSTSKRKSDHIQLAFDAVADVQDNRFYYEPILSSHPSDELIPQIKISGKLQKLPMWVSSMTGGTEKAGLINHRLANVCKQFGFGMGLGSCRIILDDNTYFEDFNLRKTLGDQLPLFANLGIAQIEELIELNQVNKATELINKLQADALIIHVNPLQEWLQPEGDRIKTPPIVTITKFLEKFPYPVWIKEVGQGIGPESLKALLNLPIAGIEFGAYGGTNFAKMESYRNEPQNQDAGIALAKVGHTALEMVDFINHIAIDKPEFIQDKMFIVSGGIRNYLDGYYCIKKLKTPAIYAQASMFLKYALESENALEQYIENQVKGLVAAYAFLTVKS